MTKILGALIGAAAALASSAFAGTIYEYSNININQRMDAGKINELRLSYNTDSSLSFFANLSNTVSQAAWFVLSPGSMPRTTADELAILYLDYAGGDVYAYRYNGNVGEATSGSQSYRDAGAFIAAYQDVLSVSEVGGTLSLSFNDLDTSAMAPGTFGADWTGVSFDEGIGIWAHFVAVDAFAAGEDGVSEFRPSLQSWYDVENKTARVPEPAGLALLGLAGVMGAAVARRRKARASA